MRIAYINGDAFGTIGTAASYRFASEVSKCHEIMVLGPQGKERSQPIVFSKPELLVIDIYDNEPMRQVCKAWHQLRLFKPQIIHLFNHRQVFRYPYLLRHLMPGVKWILDIRSPLLVNKKQGVKIRRRNIPLSLFIDAICTHSLYSVRTHLPINIRKVIEIPPGVELTQFEPAIPEIETLPPCRKFVFIGSLSPLRELEFLIENFADVASDSAEKIHLDIYGGGPEEDKLRLLIDSKKNGDKIRLIGALPQDTLSKLLSEYDAGIAYVPNGSHETAPSLKSLEFAASGIHILASDTIGHREYSHKGFKFDLFKNNPHSFREKIDRVIHERRLSTSVINNLDSVTPFAWATLVKERLLPMYESLAGL